MSLPEDAPCPRLCHLIKWPDFNGYGFNLHAEKTKQGQFIGKVDDDSPAMLAGLLEGDKIIEVNFVNICNENHRQVVERIKSITNETHLLVIDEYGDRWYRERKIVIKNSQPNVIHYRTPIPRPPMGTAPIPLSSNSLPFEQSNGATKPLTDEQIVQTGTDSNSSRRASSSLSNGGIINNHHHTNNNNNNNNGNNENKSINSSSKGTSITDSPISNHSLSTTNTSNTNTTNNNDNLDDEDNGKIIDDNSLETATEKLTINDKIHSMTSNGTGTITATETNVKNNVTSNNNNNITNNHNNNNNNNNSNNNNNNNNNNINCTTGGDCELNLNMTAAEMRKLIAQRKKKDVKMTNIDLRKKYEIIQQM